MADTWGSAQVSHGTDHFITVDLVGRHYATDGRLYVERAHIRLTIEQAHRLGEAVIAATAAASELPDSRQTALWGGSPTRETVRFRRRVV